MSNNNNSNCFKVIVLTCLMLVYSVIKSYSMSTCNFRAWGATLHRTRWSSMQPVVARTMGQFFFFPSKSHSARQETYLCANIMKATEINLPKSLQRHNSFQAAYHKIWKNSITPCTFLISFFTITGNATWIEQHIEPQRIHNLFKERFHNDELICFKNKQSASCFG